MDGRDVEDLIEEVVSHLRRVSGVAAIVLGGSRARGTATRRSDVDLALYYTPEDPLDLDALQQVAQTVDDERRKRALTGMGGWGPWINGGGWLHVHGMPVDLLYRDVQQVAGVHRAVPRGDGLDRLSAGPSPRLPDLHLQCRGGALPHPVGST